MHFNDNKWIYIIFSHSSSSSMITNSNWSPFSMQSKTISNYASYSPWFFNLRESLSYFVRRTNRSITSSMQSVVYAYIGHDLSIDSNILKDTRPVLCFPIFKINLTLYIAFFRVLRFLRAFIRFLRFLRFFIWSNTCISLSLLKSK